MSISKQEMTDYLKAHFSDRIHSQAEYVSDIIDELSKEGINTIQDLEYLLMKYPLNEYIPNLENEVGIRLSDVGVIRSLLVARKIDEIKGVIRNWEPLPRKPDQIKDNAPFVDIGSGVASYLIKSGNSIKICTTNKGELDISYDELGNRIGMGLPYLRRLAGRLESFRDILSSEARADA